MQKVHLDTDLGGDIDDLCALALLLRWKPPVEITAITVVGDSAGRRAGYTRYALRLEGREAIPVAAGADTSQGYYPYDLGLPSEDRYYPEPVPASPNPPEDAIELLRSSIEQGATIVGIGPYTNLYLLDLKYPGILAQAKLFLMGGYVYPPRQGFPPWENRDDFNIQVDVRSAKHVLLHSNPTLIPLSVTVETALRRACLPALRQAGALGQLIARQAEAFALDEQIDLRYGIICPGLPPDIINFQHDPLACAIALGWKAGVEIQEMRLRVEEKDGLLWEIPDPGGRLFRVVTRIDAPAFNQFWENIVAMR
ncbi:MAG TPA: nucleoside hydrolase [Anaerolineaceae bacterium]